MASTKSRGKDRGKADRVVQGSFVRDFGERRGVWWELPEFVLFAFERRVEEANAGASADERASLNDYVETELVNLITLRDVAELESSAPGFGAAVRKWLDEID